MKQGRVMLEFLFSVLAALRVFVCSRSDIALEVLALRQQVAVLKRQRPRPTLTRLDRFFWTTLRHLCGPMVGRAAHRETGDRRPVASSRLSPLLALAIPTAQGRPRISEEIRTPDPSPGSGEC
jgi:hypothetical protein